MSDRIRVVLDRSVQETHLIKLAYKHRWWVHDRHAQDGDAPTEYVYRSADGASFLHWIEDHKLGVNYILVKGPATLEIVRILRENLACFSPAYIAKRARETDLSPEERWRALYHLGIDKMEDGFDQETFEIYAEAMRHSEAVVRGAAVLGSAYLGWPELAEPLRALATAAEPDESIRRDAGIVVERLVTTRP